MCLVYGICILDNKLKKFMSEALFEKYPELFHYTTAVGLEGILSTKTLWATHYEYVNDSDEFKSFFKTRLPEVLGEVIPSALAEKYRDSPEFKSEVDGFPKGLEAFTQAFIGDALKATSEAIWGSYAPYLTSFCGATTPEITQDGLLSQWRGYGQDGGYAIVFNTQALEALFWLEHSKYLLKFQTICEIAYNPQSSERSDIKKLEDEVKTSFRNYIKTLEPTDIWASMVPNIRMALMHKHGGFSEEAEVRIAIIPSTSTEFEEAALSSSPSTKKLLPTTFSIKDGLLVPRLTLFNGLPIKRIIVGPHPDSVRRKKSVEMLLAKYKVQAEVTCSKIPYVGR